MKRASLISCYSFWPHWFFHHGERGRDSAEQNERLQRAGDGEGIGRGKRR